MWVPLIENNEHHSHGADHFVKQHIRNLMEKWELIDTVLLACTHYPLLQDKIEEYLPVGVKLLSQGDIVATSLADYLERHPEMESRCAKGGSRRFYTTDSARDFENHASSFFGQAVQAEHIDIGQKFN